MAAAAITAVVVTTADAGSQVDADSRVAVASPAGVDLKALGAERHAADSQDAVPLAAGSMAARASTAAVEEASTVAADSTVVEDPTAVAVTGN
jgi:hypothetical protein